nr:crustin 114 [Rimicaris sp.]
MMLIRAAAVLLAVLVTITEAGSMGVGPTGAPVCRHYCIRETPNREKYCCDRGNLPDVPAQTHAGRCPYVIPCPVSLLGSRSEPPRPCAQDAHCRYHEKCCYDSCLKFHACKLST